MSNRMRKATGIILVAASVLICSVTTVVPRPEHTARYRNGNHQQWVMNPTGIFQNGTVRINDADAEELTELPGIGDTLAGLMVQERQKNGPFYYPEDLEAVNGIGPMTVGKICSMIDLSQDESEE